MTMKHCFKLRCVMAFALAFWGWQSSLALAQQTVTVQDGIKIIKDVPYTRDNDPNRMLDIYIPVQPSRPLPLVIMIHGGGWNAGDKRDFGGVCLSLVHRGYAVASLNYRLSSQAIFPAQAIDCKAAVRWLRVHAAQYGFDSQRFVVGGHSAGGHLSAFLGATNGDTQFDQGENLGVRSDVQAVLWFAGVSDLLKRAQTSGYEFEGAPTSDQSLLVGGSLLQNPDKARAASPIVYVGAKTAPFIIFHGDSDRLVPVSQAWDMYHALQIHHIDSEIHILPHADHGGPGYFTPTMFGQIDVFLRRVLKWRAPDTRFVPGDSAYVLSPVSAPDLALAGDADTTGGGKIGLSAGAARWRFMATKDGNFIIHPADNPNGALTVQGGGTANQTPVVVMPDQGFASQRWLVRRDAITGAYALLPQCAPDSGLDDFGGNATPAAVVDIFNFNDGDPHEHWMLTAAGKR